MLKNIAIPPSFFKWIEKRAKRAEMIDGTAWITFWRSFPNRASRNKDKYSRNFKQSKNQVLLLPKAKIVNIKKVKRVFTFTSITSIDALLVKSIFSWMGTCSVTTQVRGHHSWVNTAKAESKQLQLTEWATSAKWKSLQNQQQCMENFENFLQEQRSNNTPTLVTWYGWWRHTFFIFKWSTKGGPFKN